ncbi:TPA: hypothetical protein DCG61_00435 [Patescibacteria group bacterium]|jgi:apolipoprotein N-acyltransferase|nr:hypothetical protein [Patescibacteria group bacterium]
MIWREYVLENLYEYFIIWILLVAAQFFALLTMTVASSYWLSIILSLFLLAVSAEKLLALLPKASKRRWIFYFSFLGWGMIYCWSTASLTARNSSLFGWSIFFQLLGLFLAASMIYFLTGFIFDEVKKQPAKKTP